MKLLFTAIAACMLLTSQAQIKTPQPSPSQTIKQDFGLSSVELSYSRPGIKKRKLYTDIAPAGKVWRTGANGATTITFGDEVMIGNTKLAAGKYGLLSIPAKKQWILIISKQTDVNNPANYKESEDVVRVPVTVSTSKESIETLTMQFANIKPTSCELQIRWGTSTVTLPIATNIEDKVMASIQTSMQSNDPAYFQSAMFYMENGKDLNQALSWLQKAVEKDKDAYWIQHQLANCYARLGKKTEAKAAATKSRELAAAAKNADYVKLNDDLLKELAKN